MISPVVGFAGLSHLGLVSAVATASRGFSVVAFDPDPTLIAELAEGHFPIFEPGLRELYEDSRAQLRFSDAASSMSACDVVYIASDVPTDRSGAADLASVARLIEQVAPSLGTSASLVVLSQVPPGFTRGISLPRARVFHQVETLVFGRAVERATRPERFIVGCADPKGGLPAPYATVLEAFQCPIFPMRYESAELAKISINCCLAASLSIVNTLAEISERVDADWAEIAPALRADRRIGEHAYLSPGLGIGGGNIERDLVAVLRMSAAAGTESGVVAAFRRNSACRRDWVLRVLHTEVFAREPRAVIGILGLAYKENTNSTKNSPALALIEHLKPWQVQVHDPALRAPAGVHPALTDAASALEALSGVQALAVMTPWPCFRDLDVVDIASAMAGRVIVDPFRALEGSSLAAAGFDYFTLGAPALRGRAQVAHA